MPAFRWFTLGGMLWMMGDNVEHVISYWVLFEKFESPLLGGYAVISHWAPFLLGGVYFGALADKMDCRKLFIISMVLFAFVSLGWAFVFWTDTLSVWHAVIFLTLHGLAGGLFSPASQLVIHDIVGNNQLTSAVRLTATSRQVSLMLGPAVGGALLLTLGPAAGIAVNAALYIPLIWWSLREPYTGHAETPPEELAKRPLNWGLGSAWTTFRESAGNRTIFGMICLVGLTSLLVGNAFQAQMPEFAKSFLGHDSGVVYSALLVAGAAGAIFGGLVQETISSMSPSPRKAVVLAVSWTVCILVFAAAPNYIVALMALFVSGALLISFTSMAQAMVQLEAPPDRRGRYVGLFNMSLNGMRIGSGVSVGFLGALIGIHWSLALSSLALILALVPIMLYVRARNDRTRSVSA